MDNKTKPMLFALGIATSIGALTGLGPVLQLYHL